MDNKQIKSEKSCDDILYETLKKVSDTTIDAIEIMNEAVKREYTNGCVPYTAITEIVKVITDAFLHQSSGIASIPIPGIFNKHSVKECSNDLLNKEIKSIMDEKIREMMANANLVVVSGVRPLIRKHLYPYMREHALTYEMAYDKIDEVFEALIKFPLIRSISKNDSYIKVKIRDTIFSDQYD
jgi:hypothetical protein